MSELSKEEYQEYQNINKNAELNNNKNVKYLKKHLVHQSRFLLKLYQILEEDKYKDIIHWGENGKYFEIENVHDFTEKILPQYYNHNNYSSFVRQLNMYDFHKKKTNSEGHAFQHSRFIKGQQELIKTILRKKKKDKTKNITSLVPLNPNIFKYNKMNKIQNTSIDKHSLSIDEDKDNNQFNADNIEQSLIEYNKKNYLPQSINDQYATIQLKQNLMTENNDINMNNNKKITKKSIYDLLNNLINNADDNSRKQKILNLKIDSLSNKCSEYINKNNTLLDEIKSKVDYNKKFETVVCFILEIQKIKNEGSLKNILISNDINNNPKHDNSNDLNNLEIINLAEPNGIVPANDYLQKKTFNNGNFDSFQLFLNKYMDKNKNRGLLTNSETINNKSETKENENKNNNNNLLSVNMDLKNDNDSNKEDLKDINKSIFKDNLEEKKNLTQSMDFSSSIFHRQRSSSFNSLFSNNTNNFNDNFNNNNDFILKKDENNNNAKTISNNNNQNNNDINISNNLNKSFDVTTDLNQDKNFDRKDSLNNSSISYFDLENNKSDKMSDIFGGENSSINFA
jgi:hypothetical protein